MLLHALVLSLFAIGMAAVIILSRLGEPREREREQAEDDQEPQELRAAA